MKPIPFFDQEIKIKPHTATYAARIGTPISIKDFAGERCVCLYEEENGDLLCQSLRGPYREVAEFIVGKEVKEYETA